MTLAVSFSYFMFEITLLNLNKISFSNSLEKIGEGSYSNIHIFEVTEERAMIVLKSI